MDLQKVFTPGASFQQGGQPVAVEVRRVAELFLPSGRIVACDPLVNPESEPYSRSVAPGTYPVELAIARVSPDNPRVASARVLFREGTPSRFELASVRALPADLGPDEFVGYGVDAGMGCFMDAEAGRLLTQACDALAESQSYYDVLARELQARPDDKPDWVDHRPDPTRRENVVVFESGWGDGIYPSYWALDAAGEPLWLATDFEVLSQEEEASA